MTQILSLERQVKTPLPSAEPCVEQTIGQLLDGRDLDREASRRWFAEIVEGRLSEPLMAATAPAQKILPTTAASASIDFARGSCMSRRAAISACTEAGNGTVAPARSAQVSPLRTRPSLSFRSLTSSPA